MSLHKSVSFQPERSGVEKSFDVTKRQDFSRVPFGQARNDTLLELCKRSIIFGCQNTNIEYSMLYSCRPFEVVVHNLMRL